MKRMMNFFTALAAILTVQLSVLVVGAEAANGIYASSAELSQSEEFFVEIAVPPAENADTASVMVEFDENIFEVIEWNTEIAGGISNSGEGFFGLSAANAERKIELGSGIVFSAKMKVKEEAAKGEYSINLVKSSFCYVMDNGYEFKELWFPETTEIIVEISGNAVEEANAEFSEKRLVSISNDNNSNVAVIICAIVIPLVVAGVMIRKKVIKIIDKD